MNNKKNLSMSSDTGEALCDDFSTAGGKVELPDLTFSEGSPLWAVACVGRKLSKSMASAAGRAPDRLNHRFGSDGRLFNATVTDGSGVSTKSCVRQTPFVVSHLVLAKLPLAWLCA